MSILKGIPESAAVFDLSFANISTTKFQIHLDLLLSDTTVRVSSIYDRYVIG